MFMHITYAYRPCRGTKSKSVTIRDELRLNVFEKWKLRRIFGLMREKAT
jgi:hypothetical protein